MNHTPECFSAHMGLYACEPAWLREAVAHVRAGRYPAARSAAGMGRDGPLFDLTDDGIARIPVAGPMFKGVSKFSEANTVRLRAAVREAAASEEVHGILLHVDSPGGTVAGTADLAEEVRAAAAVKPVHAFIEDMGASAAFWVASQAAHVSATPTSEVGSIGVVTVIEDTSGAADLKGIVVHVIATGPFKGAFAHGAPVPEEHISDMRRRVEDINAHFLAAVGRGRGMAGPALRAIADGRVWIAAEAQGLGLIDSIGGLTEAMARLRTASTGRISKDRRRRAAVARLRLLEAGG